MLTQIEQRNLAELAFIRSIADKELDENDIKNGRLKGLFLKLRKAVDKDIARTGLYPSKIDIKTIETKLDTLKYTIGPCDEEFTAIAMISFCFGFMENSDTEISEQVINTLNNIVDYFERAGRLDLTSHYQDGQAATDVWEGLFTE